MEYNTISDNPKLKLAWELIENTGCSLYLTGKAGTGKTTFLRSLVENSRKRLVVLAPTGIAAINAGGVTIHSFFQLPFGPFIPGARRADSARYRIGKSKVALIRSLDLVVIDEISMVRSDLLDAVDDALKRIRRSPLPFGGVQMLLIGDLQQLPPVVKDDEAEMLRPFYNSPYFFDSTALSAVPMKCVELDMVYRQTDTAFLSLLNDIRTGAPKESTLRALNSRYIPGFVPPEGTDYIRLTTHNATARDINSHQLGLLDSPSFTYSASVKGKFPETSFPADDRLVLKQGAQVMFIKNDPSGEKKYYNGMMGRVVDLSDEHVYVKVPESEFPIDVTAEEWLNNRYEVEADSGEIKEVREGSFSQIPLRLAWAVTVHKSQGLTFDNAVIDVSRSFAHGHAYVALSRCRTLDGLVLDSPIGYNAVISDGRVNDFLNTCAANPLSNDELKYLTFNYALECLDNLFALSALNDAHSEYYRVVAEAFCKTQPGIADRHNRFAEEILAPLSAVASRFALQYRSLAAADPGQDVCRAVAKRVREASAYFSKQLSPLTGLIADTPVTHTSKALSKKLSEKRKELSDALKEALYIFSALGNEDFSPALYHKLRSEVVLSDLRQPSTGISKSPTGISKKEGQATCSRSSRTKAPRRICEGITYDDLLNPEIYDALAEWRNAVSKSLGIPAFTIAHNRMLALISDALPTTTDELLAIPYVGKSFCTRYGSDVLEIIDEFRPTTI